MRVSINLKVPLLWAIYLVDISALVGQVLDDPAVPTKARRLVTQWALKRDLLDWGRLLTKAFPSYSDPARTSTSSSRILAIRASIEPTWPSVSISLSERVAVRRRPPIYPRAVW